jgi:exonuclease SbcD
VIRPGGGALQGGAHMETVRILHTSDVHIGAPFLFLGGKGNEQRLALREALSAIVRIAKQERFDALVIAGDLFDSAFGASDADVSFVAGCLAGAGPACRVVILPGSHDYYAPGSVYERERRRFEAPGNVHILTPERRTIEMDELSLAVHGVAGVSNVRLESAFSGLVPREGYRWNVCLAHGSVEGYSARPEPGEAPLRIAELGNGFDYVALGHWHSHLVVSRKDPLAAYSGSPEIIARDQQGSGFAAAITLSKGGSSLERIQVGKRRVERRAVDCTPLQSTEELVGKVLEAAPADPDVVLELSLNGLVGVGSALDPERGAAELERHYFSVRLLGKGPSREMSKEELLAVPEDTVAGAFVRRMLRRIESAPEEKRELYEEALQLGYQLFKGRDLIG